MTVTVEFIHLHALRLTVWKKKEKASAIITTATTTLFSDSLEVKVSALQHLKKLVLLNETPGNSLFNMYINHFGVKYLIHMVEPIHRLRLEEGDKQESNYCGSQQNPPACLTRSATALLDHTQLHYTCTYNIAYFSIMFNILYRPYNRSCSNI